MTPEEKIRIQDQISFIRSIPKGALHYLADICEELYQEVNVLTTKLKTAEKEIKRLKAMANRWINEDEIHEDLAEIRDCGDK